MLFALGNISPILEALYPSCWNSTLAPPCSLTLVSSLTYVEVLGVIVGMLSFGLFADKLGRRWGSCTTALTMLLGALLVTASYAGPDQLNGMFAMFAVSLFIFSYGVGGEYPLASASAAEAAEAAHASDSTCRTVRGESVIFAFAMQGVGNVTNTLVILVILLALGCTSSECGAHAMVVAWRLQYGIGALFVLVLAAGRVLFLKESKVWLESRERRRLLASADRAEELREHDALQTHKAKHHHRQSRLLVRHYWSRLVGTAGGWFLWDVVFYGNRLFQGSIIQVLVPGAPSVVKTLEYTLLNASVAMLGYYAAALCIDKPWMGRRKLQNIGFFMTFVLFLICAALFDTLRIPTNIGWFQALYYLSSFFGMFGANSTTFLLPSESYPTSVRTRAHGLSAACGKLGALAATLLFSLGNGGRPMTPDTIFYVCSACCLLGLVLTVIFVPDVTELDLKQLDVQWELILKDDLASYHGEANNYKFLSWFEVTCQSAGCSCEICEKQRPRSTVDDDDDDDAPPPPAPDPVVLKPADKPAESTQLLNGAGTGNNAHNVSIVTGAAETSMATV